MGRNSELIDRNGLGTSTIKYRYGISLLFA